MAWKGALALLAVIGIGLAVARKYLGTGVIGGIGTELGEFGGGLQKGISEALSPQIRPVFHPEIGLTLTGALGAAPGEPGTKGGEGCFYADWMGNCPEGTQKRGAWPNAYCCPTPSTTGSAVKGGGGVGPEVTNIRYDGRPNEAIAPSPPTMQRRCREYSISGSGECLYWEDVRLDGRPNP